MTHTNCNNHNNGHRTTVTKSRREREFVAECFDCTAHFLPTRFRADAIIDATAHETETNHPCPQCGQA